MTHRLSADEQKKLVELTRTKRLATGVLLLCFLFMVVTRLLEVRYPSLAYLSAFAEAATIGGLADWYAVVALFKHPMNLPIPHTAIIQNNQHRIGNNLGRFIESNFLSRETVEEKLRQVDFAGEMSNWLANETRSRQLAKFVARLIPQILETIDHSGMRTFAVNRITNQIEKTEVAPIAGKLLDSFVKDGRHNKLMDDLISALHRFISDERALETIRLKVHDELPSLFNVFRADAIILRRIVKAGGALLEEVKNDPEHELRDEFEKFLKDYVRRIKRSKRFAKRAEAMKHDILARPEFADIADRLWSSLRTYLERDIHETDSATVRRLSELFADIGKNLAHEKVLRADMNAELTRILSNLVEQQKGSVSKFVADQVKGWDFAQLTLLIEANIGKDLQYIRFNGMIIGGIAGVTLHAIVELIRAV